MLSSPLILFLDFAMGVFMLGAIASVLVATHGTAALRSTIRLTRFWYVKPTLQDFSEDRFEVAAIVVESAKRITMGVAWAFLLISCIQFITGPSAPWHWYPEQPVNWGILSSLAAVGLPLIYGLMLNIFLWEPLSGFCKG